MAYTRTENVALNTITRTMASVILILLNFWSRSVFFSSLGQDLLGINSLFQDVLNILDFTELGFSTVWMVSMYEPIANHDHAKIHSLLELSKVVYRWVMLAIAVFGLLSIPILRFVNTDISFTEMIIYYIPFLLNNILSYLWAYRETYLDACQKHYKLFFADIFQAAGSIIVRTLVLMWFGSYMGYILVMICFTVVKKLSFNHIIKKECPEVIYDHADPVDKQTKDSIIAKSKAMMVQKFSTLGISQTDSFIVSVVLNSSTWAIVSNYNLIKSSITTLLNGIIHAVIPSMGNLMNSEGQEKQMSVFYQYDFINNWIYILFFAELFPLVNMVITIIFSDKMLMKPYEIFIFFLSFYLQGLLSPINVMRESSGMFEKDQWVSIVACLSNLVTSVVFIKIYGLVGVFYGTIISTVVFMVFRVLIYFNNYADKKHIWPYYMTVIKNIAVCMVTVGATYAVYSHFLASRFTGFFGLIINGVILLCVYLVMFVALSFRNPNFYAFMNRLRSFIH